MFTSPSEMSSVSQVSEMARMGMLRSWVHFLISSISYRNLFIDLCSGGQSWCAYTSICVLPVIEPLEETTAGWACWDWATDDPVTLPKDHSRTVIWTGQESPFIAAAASLWKIARRVDCVPNRRDGILRHSVTRMSCAQHDSAQQQHQPCSPWIHDGRTICTKRLMPTSKNRCMPRTFLFFFFNTGFVLVGGPVRTAHNVAWPALFHRRFC